MTKAWLHMRYNQDYFTCKLNNAWACWSLLWWICILVQSCISQIHCPSVCQCEDTMGIVDCSHVNTSLVPYGIETESVHSSYHQLPAQSNHTLLDNVYVLRLDHNRIEELPQVTLNMSNLIQLYLNDNQLTEILPLSFAALTNLRILDISNNQITEISFDLFQNTVSLQSVNMSHNKIRSVLEGAFDALSQVIQLDMSYNPLITLPQHLFRNLTSLELLSLSNTQLSVIQSSYFGYTPLLFSVDLSFNHIKLVDKATVDNLSTLTRLNYFNLSHNPLQCTCSLGHLRTWLGHVRNVVKSVTTCSDAHHKGKQLLDIALSDLQCSKPKQQVMEKTTLSYYDSKPTIGPLVYNPQLGWYTGGVLSIMLLMFLICLGMDRLKRYGIKMYKKRRLKRLKLKYKQERANDEQGGIEGDRESLNSFQTASITPVTAFHEQYLSIMNYKHQLQPPTLPQQQQPSSNYQIPSAATSASVDPIPEVMIERESPRTDLSKENTAQRNLIDPNKLRQEKVSRKQRINGAGQLNTLPHMDMRRASSASCDDKNEEVLGMHVREVHPECPIHSPAANTRFRAMYEAAI